MKVSGVTTPPNALINQYLTRDERWILLIVIQPDKDWPRFAAALGHPEWLDDACFAEVRARLENAQALAQEIQVTFETKDFAKWKQILDDAKITFGVVGRTEEAPHDAQMRANDFFVGFEHETLGKVEVVNSPIWLQGETKRQPQRAPQLGEHTDEVLAELGYDSDKVSALRKSGALG